MSIPCHLGKVKGNKGGLGVYNVGGREIYLMSVVEELCQCSVGLPPSAIFVYLDYALIQYMFMHSRIHADILGLGDLCSFKCTLG